MDEKVYGKIFDDNYVALCVFAERMEMGGDTAADIVQDCFAALWQRRGGFADPRSARAFLYTSVRNRALNELAHQRTVRKYESAAAKAEDDRFFHDHVIEQELYRILTAEISKLPTQTRNVMMLAIEGYRGAEIAERLNMAEGTVQTHKKLAYKRLRKTLKGSLVEALLVSILF
jgi:RNA polymerase sigma-70 factor (ECF subfamily)